MDIESKIDELARELLYEVAKEVDNKNYFEIKNQLCNYDCHKIEDTQTRIITYNLIIKAREILDKEIENVILFKDNYNLPKEKEKVEAPEDNLESDTDDVEDHSEYEKGEI